MHANRVRPIIRQNDHSADEGKKTPMLRSGACVLPNRCRSPIAPSPATAWRGAGEGGAFAATDGEAQTMAGMRVVRGGSRWISASLSRIIGNNGWLISTTGAAVQADLRAEQAGRAAGGALRLRLRSLDDQAARLRRQSEFWDHNLRSFTLMAGLAVTKRIQLYASVAVLTIPPAIVARMTSTIDAISGRTVRRQLHRLRAGARPSIRRWSLWPGDRHFTERYDYSSEYVTVMRELWENGHVELQGQHFHMEDCSFLAQARRSTSDRPAPDRAPRGIRSGPSTARLQFRRRQRLQHADRPRADQPGPWPRPPPRPVTAATTSC